MFIDHAGILQHLEMLRHRRPRDVDQFGQRSDGRLTKLAEASKYLPSTWFRNHFKRRHPINGKSRLTLLSTDATTAVDIEADAGQEASLL